MRKNTGWNLMLSCMINSCRYNWSQCCNHHHPLSLIIIYPLMSSLIISYHHIQHISTLCIIIIWLQHIIYDQQPLSAWKHILTVCPRQGIFIAFIIASSSLTLRQAVSRRGMPAEVNSLSAVPRQEYKLFYRHCLSDKQSK